MWKLQKSLLVYLHSSPPPPPHSFLNPSQKIGQIQCQPWFCFRLLKIEIIKYTFLLQSSYSVGNTWSFYRAKAAGAWCWPSLFHLVPRLRPLRSLYVLTAWTGTTLPFFYPFVNISSFIHERQEQGHTICHSVPSSFSRFVVRAVVTACRSCGLLTQLCVKKYTNDVWKCAADALCCFETSVNYSSARCWHPRKLEYSAAPLREPKSHKAYFFKCGNI